MKNEQTSVEQSVTFYSVQEIKALEEKLVECLNKLNFILLLQQRYLYSWQVPYLKYSNMLSCVLNQWPRFSCILSNQVSFVAAQLLHADTSEDALSPYYQDQEQLLCKPASYKAVKVPRSTVASEQGHFSRLYCRTHTQHPQSMRQQQDQRLSKGYPYLPPNSRFHLKQ